MHATFQMLTSLVLVATCAVAAVTDFKTGRIPNTVTFPALLIGVLVQSVANGGWGLVESLGGAFLLMLVPWVLYRASGGTAIGGGDLKLFGAIGALAGPTLGLEMELFAFGTVALFTLVRLTFHGRLCRVLANSFALLLNPILPARYRRAIEPEQLTALRMGPFIALSTIALLSYDFVVRGGLG